MAETLRIEIPIETVDETEPQLSNLIKKIGKLGGEAEKVAKKAKKSSESVSAFDKQAEKTERSLAAWAKEKYQVLLEAKEKISPILSTLGRGLKGFTGKAWSVTLRAVDLVTSPVRGILNLLKNPIFQVGTVLGVSVGLMDTISTYQDFEAAMFQVQAISGATASEVVKLTNKAKEMGATTKFTAQESAEAFNYMAMAGWKTSDMLNGIEGILNLAAASGEDLAITSDIVTDALTAFKMKAADAGHFSDVLAAAAANANTTVSGMGETFKYAGSMAGALGYSIEDVALMAGLMANSGVKGTMAGTSMNAIFTRLATDAGATSKSLGALGVLTQELGIEFYDADRNARDLFDVMTELRTATAKMNDEEKSNLANTIAGTEAQKGLLAILNASEEDYNKLADAIRNADGAAEQMSETMMDNLQGSITLLQSAVDGVKISFGERLSPYIRNLANWLTEQMPAVEQGLNEFMDWLDTKLDRMQRKWTEITSTEEWQEADFLGKAGIAWDEFIAEPLSEWWNSTGKAKLAGFAEKIGEGIGSGLKLGVMTLLGIDIGETLDEGVSIGASFAKGFSEGFDFKAVSAKLWQGFGSLFSDAGKLLPGGKTPDLSSLFSAVMLGKLAKPFVGLGKGIFSAGKLGKTLFASGEGNLGLGRGIKNGISKLFGDFSVANEIAGTGIAGGKGLFGLFGKAGMALGSQAVSSTGLVAAGGGAVMGGIAAGTSLISGVLDAYKAIKSEDKEEAKAYKESAAWKVGGVATGSAMGAAVGSILPGIGTLIGTLIGGGIGGITGWIKGNKIKEDYQKNIEEMQREAERAQKIFEATGLSIEDVTFKNKALTEAMNDSEVSASEFALMFQEECANIAKNAFGDISLSLTEVKKIAREITFADMAKELDAFAKATSDTETALRNLQSSVSNLKKENWKVSLGMELSETDKDSYKNAIENFRKTSQEFIDDNHYEATVALNLLVGEKADTTGLDNYYNHLKVQLEEWGTKLSTNVTIALEDGVITLDEAAELENLQAQITAITSKLTEAKADAEMQTLEIKHNGAALDIESFHAMLEELQANVASASEQYENALTLTLTNLNLQRGEARINYENGLITEEEYRQIQEEIQNRTDEATKGYYARINELNVRVSTFSLGSIATAWEEELSKIMPGIEGTTTEKLTQALNNALLAHPDVTVWEEADVIKWMGLDKLNLDTAEQTTIASELIQTALAVPEGTKETILQNFKDRVPSVEEIKAALHWDSMTNSDWSALMEWIAGPVEGASFGLSAEDAAKPMAEYFGEYFENVKQSYAEVLHNALESSANNDTLDAFIKYMQTSGFTLGSFMAEYGPISNEYYEELVSEWKAAGTAYGDALNSGVSTSLLSGSSLLRADLETALNTAMASPFTVSPTVNVMPSYQMILPNFPVANQEVSGHAAGGYVGKPQLSWLAEEGYGEFVIPTNPSRRDRAIELYQQAGAALGVSTYADGGYIENTGEKESGESALTYDIVPMEKKSSINTTPIQVNVSVAPEFVIQGDDSQDEEGIIQVIKRHMREIADELGGEIAVKLEKVFSNMPKEA